MVNYDDFDLSIFAQVQMANNMQSELIPKHRKDMNRMIDAIRAIPGQLKNADLYADFRRLKREVIHKNKAFYIDPLWTVDRIPMEFRHDSFGLCEGKRLKFKGRYCTAIFDTQGDVMGFVGWDRDEDVKYLDSTNYGYKAKRTTFCGMDALPKGYREGYFIWVEGPVCKMYLEGFGFNVGSLLGSGMSDYVTRIIRRFESNAIIIPDKDEAGDKLVSLAKYLTPKARVYQSVIAKDVDDTRLKLGNDEIVNELVNLVKDKRYKSDILLRR